MKKVLYLISNTFFYAFCIFFVIVLLFSALSFLEKYWSIDIPFVEILEENSDFNSVIKLPVINATIQYDFSLSILFMWFWLLFYALYFFTLKEFFKIFIAKNVFTKKSIKKLAFFFKLNFVPIIFSLGIVVFNLFKATNENFEEEYTFITIHSCIAIIVYLYLEIFKKGQKLQEENDLTI